MPGLALTITNAGRAALINAQNTGGTALVISQIGVSATHQTGTLAAKTVLTGELKRLATFGGDVVANDTLHVSLRDESADSYSLRSFALYLSDGTLFGLYTQSTVILEKSAASMMLIAADIILTVLTTAAITFGGTGFINPPATTTVQGVVELATSAETVLGTDSVRAVTPGGLKATLTSWAQNFAAAIHGHAIADIAGLAAALAGKSSTGHTHAAADVTSGTFDVARLPDLAMAKITGLVAALAGKAAAVHEHAAADVTTGTFDPARIPSLVMGKITGLTAALAAKSDTGHTHDAGDIATGAFNVARIPELAMAKITGLVAALAGKSDTGHTHDAGATTTGTFNAARIPELAMAKITGLVDALAAKISSGSAGVLASLEIASAAPTLTFRETNDAANWFIYVQSGGLSIRRDDDNNGTSDAPHPLELERTGQTSRIWGANVWTENNFTPASKASLGTPVDFTRLRLSSTTDLSLTSTNHAFQIGPDTGSNLGIDNNEIQSRNNGTADVLYLNNDGGDVQINGYLAYHANNIPTATATVKGIVELATNAEAITGTDTVRAVTPAGVAAAIGDIPAQPNASLTVKGLVELATAAETQAGSDATRAVTPAGLWSFAKSLAATGYLQIPGTDLIIQWGTLSVSGLGGKNVVFPTVFPTACRFCIGQVNNLPSDAGMDAWIQGVGNPTTSAATLFVNQTSGATPTRIDWFAIGH